MSTTAMYPIAEVSDLDLAFGGDTDQLMPNYRDIPDQFKSGTTKWNALVSDWFFSGVSELQLEPRAGVDTQKAMRHLKAVIGSFAPKHEHKEAACAYLLDQWFSDGQWKTGKK